MELSVPVAVPENFSEQVRRERFERIVQDIKWDAVKHWWRREDGFSDLVYAQYRGLREAAYVDAAAYQAALTAHGLTYADVEPPAYVFDIMFYGESRIEKLSSHRYTAEEKADIRRRYLNCMAEKTRLAEAYANRDADLDEAWLRRLFK